MVKQQLFNSSTLIGVESRMALDGITGECIAELDLRN